MTPMGLAMLDLSVPRPDLQTIAAVIARSQIRVEEDHSWLPAGFGDTEVVILDWIASEARALRHTYPLM